MMNDSKKHFLKIRVDPINLTRKIFFEILLVMTLLSGSVTATTFDFPPPIKSISESDRRFLEAAPNISERLKRASSLMNARLSAAESSVANGDEIRMFFELGIFHGLLDDTLRNLLEYDGKKRTSSQLSNLKRFEMLLRSFPPRIELIRRNIFDPDFDSYITNLQSEIRDARSRALDPMFVKP
jgi:hypothetical protein